MQQRATQKANKIEHMQQLQQSKNKGKNAKAEKKNTHSNDYKKKKTANKNMKHIFKKQKQNKCNDNAK